MAKRKTGTEVDNSNMLPAVEVIKEAPLVKKLANMDDLFVFKCQGKKGKCGNIHFRHAGYIELMMPYIQPDKTRKVTKDSHQVHICTKCKAAYVYLKDNFYDVSDQIDVKAWERTEKVANAMTGPGGEC